MGKVQAGRWGGTVLVKSDPVRLCRDQDHRYARGLGRGECATNEKCIKRRPVRRIANPRLDRQARNFDKAAGLLALYIFQSGIIWRARQRRELFARDD